MSGNQAGFVLAFLALAAAPSHAMLTMMVMATGHTLLESLVLAAPLTIGALVLVSPALLLTIMAAFLAVLWAAMEFYMVVTVVL